MQRIESAIEVEAPVRAVYNQWTQFEDFPRFMAGVTSVRQLDDTHLRWQATVGGKEIEWDAEIIDQTPDCRIVWRSTTGARHGGKVEFAALGETRTRVVVVMEYEPDGALESIGGALGVPALGVAADLERFRAFVESRGVETGEWRGEIHRREKTRDGDPARADARPDPSVYPRKGGGGD